MTATLLTDDCVYPESPRWHQGSLWFSDVHAYAVKRVTRDGAVHHVVDVPGRPAGLGFLPDGRLLVAGALDRCLWVWDGNTIECALDLSGAASGLLNDMVVDRAGRAFVGATGFNLMAGEPRQPGQVLMAEESPDGEGWRSRLATSDVWFPNGAAVSDDLRYYWVAETAANRVSRFRITADGKLVERATIAELPDMPDGLCLTADGGVWVALLRRGEFWRLGSEGDVLAVQRSAGSLAVACITGDERRQTLFLCSAATTMEQLAQGVSSGLVHTLPAYPAGAGFP